MAKLHELLAVENDLRKAANSAIQEVKARLANRSILVGQTRRYSPLVEGGETFPNEDTNLNTTISEQLEILQQQYGSFMDVSLQKEVSNLGTSANVVVDGKILFDNLPSTALLNLEAKLIELRSVYANIPTLDPAERWEYDEGQGHYVSSERETHRTKKIHRNHTLYDATDKHPAQVQVYTEDERVGTWTTVIHSGMITQTDKRQRLSRIDRLIHEVKKARQRANDITADEKTYAAQVFNYINNG